MSRGALLALAVAVIAGPAMAQAFLGAGEARRTFLGMDMEGVHQPSGERWRECIDPHGRTTYWYAGTVDEGRLTVRNDGVLCFSYASSQYQSNSCWRAIRQGRAGFRFESADGDGGGVFVTTGARRVSSCQGRDVPVS